jgi:hypothetical protein
VGCFDSSIWQGQISCLLDWLCKTTIKRKFRISQKRKLPLPHLFRRKSLFHFRFHFRQKNSVFISVPQISVFVSIFSFRFCFSAEKSESFRSTFIPTCQSPELIRWDDGEVVANACEGKSRMDQRSWCPCPTVNTNYRDSIDEYAMSVPLGGERDGWTRRSVIETGIMSLSRFRFHDGDEILLLL